MPDLMMESQERGDVVVIYPRGFINAHTVREFEQELERSVESGRTRIVINGAGLSYIASAGLGVIMGHIEEVRSQGGGYPTYGSQRDGPEHFRSLGIQSPL